MAAIQLAGWQSGSRRDSSSSSRQYTRTRYAQDAARTKPRSPTGPPRSIVYALSLPCSMHAQSQQVKSIRRGRKLTEGSVHNTSPGRASDGCEGSTQAKGCLPAPALGACSEATMASRHVQRSGAGRWVSGITFSRIELYSHRAFTAIVHLEAVSRRILRPYLTGRVSRGSAV